MELARSAQLLDGEAEIQTLAVRAPNPYAFLRLGEYFIE